MDLSYKQRIKRRFKAWVYRCFPALLHRNFRYFFVGQAISLIGTWMQNAGQSWLVLQITDNALLLGILNAAQFIPMLCFSLFAGVVVDRFPKRKIIIITQIVMMLCALALAFFIWTGYVEYIYILIIALILGIAQSLDMPARQSFMVELVGKEDLMNAIALNSSIFNGARVIGPALAGMVMAFLGAGTAFFINGVTFIAVIYGLFKIQTDDRGHVEMSDKSILTNVVEGIKYIGKNPVLYATMFLIAVVWVFCLNFNTLIPVFAMNVLEEKELGYGLLMSAMGVGAMTGALSLAVKSGRGAKYGVFLLGGGTLSVFMIATGLQRSYLLSALFLCISGWGMVTFAASANSILQLNSPDNMRGRIMSVYALVSGGVVPFGSIYAGYMSETFGANMTFIISGIIGTVVIAFAGLLYYRYKPMGSK